MKLTRRSVLQAIAAVGVANSAVALAASGNKHRVIVVGAGPSGLAAAYDLSEAGHEVTVFEARSRSGGRMHTLRDAFDDGLYAEAGAAVLTEDNPGLEYARQFGLEIAPIGFPMDARSIAHVAGKRIVETPRAKTDWPFPVDEAEANLLIQQMKTKYYRRPMYEMEGLSRMLSDDFPQDEFLYLDDMSIADFWRENGASDGAVRLMGLGYFEAYSDSPESASALGIAREFASLIGSRAALRVVGGNDKICAELAARLPEPVHFNSPVVAVEQNESGADVIVESDGERQRVTGDYVVVTAPLHVWSKIEFNPPMSKLRNAAIDEIESGDVCRTFVQTKTRFWEKDGYSGVAVTDLPIGSVLHSTQGQEGTRGILESFTYSARAREMGAMAGPERYQATVSGMSKVFPGVEEQAENGTSYDWGGDPWALGGHVSFKTGQVGKFSKALREPEGRVHFAGDLIGGVSGYSHAAFKSGKDVAVTINSL